PFRGRVNLRNHRKVAIFDGSWAWFGGLNLASEYLGPRPLEGRWEDLSIRIGGEAVNQLQRGFEWDWAYAGGKPASTGAQPDPAVQPKQEGRPGHAAQVVASGPDIPEDLLYEALLEACFDARNRIWIATPYFVPDESLIKALELACRRGVDVRLL